MSRTRTGRYESYPEQHRFGNVRRRVGSGEKKEAERGKIART